MGAVWLRFRAELRTRWRAWLGLALLIGLAAGAVMALLAGGRRTDTAYERFLRAEHAYDLVVVNNEADGTAIFDFDEIARLPQVVDSASGVLVYFDIGPGVGAVAPRSDRFGTELNGVEILEGRRADPRRVDEAVIPFTMADDYGLRVGDRISVFGSAEQVRRFLTSPGISDADRARIERLLGRLPGGKVRIVGIGASPGDFPPQLATGGSIVHLTPAFAKVVGPSHDSEVLAVRLRHGSADLPAFQRALERRSRGRPIEATAQAGSTRNVERSIHLQAVALRILALLVGIVAALIAGQLLARLCALEASDGPTLQALGMARGQRWLLGLWRAALIGVGAGVVGVVLAVALSPLFPTGLARIAELDTGVSIDGLVLTAGLVATIVVVVALAAWPAWRSAAVRVDDPAGRHPSRLVTLLAGLRARPSTVAGVRMALEPGRGATAVPVRSTLAGVALGLAALIAALTFGASLTHLLDTPRLYGLTWSGELTNYGAGPDLPTVGARVLRGVHGVKAFAVGDSDFELAVEGDHRVTVQASALALDPTVGTVRPPIVAGRAPAGIHEVALGAKTMRAAGVGIGDSIRLRIPGGDTSLRARVVGQTVLPALSEGARLGDGVFMTRAAELRLLAAFTAESQQAFVSSGQLFVRLAPGTRVADVNNTLNRRLSAACAADPSLPGCADAGTGTVVITRGEPTDIVNVGRIESAPLLLGGVLALLAAGTLVHVLVSAVRRRRRDLAILKTLGFTRRQTRSTVAWQATVLTAIALVVAVPLGLVVGRGIWSRFADDLGIVDEPRVAWLAIAILIPAALVLANLIAAFPARSAARTRPALVLRSE